MWALIKECYGRSARFAIALPLLFALPVAAELIQHIAEYMIGMFASIDAMVALGDNAWRMGFGVAKVVTLFVYVYWVSRWLAFGTDRSRRVLGDGRSAFLYAWVLAYGLVGGGLQLFGGALLGPFGMGDGTLMVVGLAFFLLSTALDIYLSSWKVGAALGNGRLTIAASLRMMHGNFWWSVGFSLATILPLMIPHYVLGVLAIGKPDVMLWAVLVVDALLVGYLGTVLAAASFLIARRAAERAGASLT